MRGLVCFSLHYNIKQSPAEEGFNGSTVAVPLSIRALVNKNKIEK